MTPKKTATVKSIVHETIPIAEGREIQIREIPQDVGDLLRIGLYLDDGSSYSGATFPVQLLDQVIKALQQTRMNIRSRK